ncbi:tyrosine-type recombinase/integrase [Cytobacillus kochii]|uniref:tyrosine-type recombinase/integrase n=1 Tax=Cytobacillus kochii TaxID=859143 RepID=UPI001CD483C2|nr:tyrosine-type recombinase/integrase [Cytobacillus kochii]MCA1025772.1 tyrosine-type recombinase/integrase [Cytobacillus kochii]
MLFEEALDEYIVHCLARGYTPKTMKNKKQEYKHLKIFLVEKRGIRDLKNITDHDLKSYFRKKQKDGLQPQSIVSMYKMINAFFNWCVKEEYIEKNPMVKVERPKEPKKVLNGFTDDEVIAMINAFTTKTFLEARNKAIIMMLADCGLRAIEIRTFKLKTLLDKDNIVVNGKGNKERYVPITPALKKVLIKYERMKEKYFNDWVSTADNYFLNYQGGEISHTALYNVIVKAGKRAKIEDARCSPHTFRHYYAVKALSSDKTDLYSLSRLLGHSDVSTTQRYLRTLDDKTLTEKAIDISPLMNMGKKLKI